MIRDEGATRLAPGLSAMTGLMGLYLSCKCALACTLSIPQQCASTYIFTAFGCVNNSVIQICDQGATQIAAALKNMQCLTSLNLDGKCVVGICLLLQSPTKRGLSLAWVYMCCDVDPNLNACVHERYGRVGFVVIFCNTLRIRQHPE